MRPVLIIAALAFALFAADTADACSRCGLFGRRCRFQHHHQAFAVKAVNHHIPAYQAPSTTLNIVNNYPNALLAPQGTADYGISLRNSIQPLGSEFYGQQSARLLEHSVDVLNVSAGLAVSERENLQALQSKALDVQELSAYVDGVRAIKGGGTASQQVLQYKLSDKGIEAVGRQGGSEQADHGGPAQSPPGERPQFSIDQIFTAACARCHTGEKAKGGLQLDDGLTQAELEAMQEQVRSGSMPPEDTPERAVIDQLRALLGE